MPTEFIQIDGAKISGSKGNTISLSDWLYFAEPELLRFMIASYKPQTAINFDLHSNKFFLLADRYDASQRAYFDAESKEKRDHQLTAIYKYSQVHAIPTSMPMQLSYNLAVVIVQTFPNKKLREIVDVLHEHGWLHSKQLTPYDEERLEKKMALARNWLTKYAPEDVKFVVQEQVPKNLNIGPKEKEALHALAKKLKEKEWTQDELFNEFYTLCTTLGIKNTDFFKAAYAVLLNKERGPKLAPFILTLGREKVAKLFEDV